VQKGRRDDIDAVSDSEVPVTRKHRSPHQGDWNQSAPL
jgi:hypothetical protein